jgi:hypothetical protein
MENEQRRYDRPQENYLETALGVADVPNTQSAKNEVQAVHQQVTNEGALHLARAKLVARSLKSITDRTLTTASVPTR